MSDVASLFIKVDSSGVVTATRNLADFTGEGKKAETGTQSLEKSIKSMIAQAAAIWAAVKTVTAFAQAFFEAEEAAAKLGGVLHATGNQIGYNQRQLEGMAYEIQRVTKFSDDSAMAAESVLLTYTKIGRDAFPRVLKASADLASLMGGDLASAAQLVGIAMEDTEAGATRLRRAGVVLSDDQLKLAKSMTLAGDAAGAQNVILSALEERVGGLAQVIGDTDSGGLQKMVNAFNDLEEAAGGFLSRTFRPLIQELTDAFNQLSLREKLAEMPHGPGTTTTQKMEYELTRYQWIASEIARLQKEGAREAGSGPLGAGARASIAREIADLNKELEESARLQYQYARSSAEAAKLASKEADEVRELTKRMEEAAAAADRLSGASGFTGPEGGPRFAPPVSAAGPLTGATAQVDDLWGDIAQYAYQAEKSVAAIADPWMTMMIHKSQEAAGAAQEIDTTWSKLAEDLERMVASQIITGLENIGEALGSGESAGDAVGEMILSLARALPMLFLSAGLQILIGSMGQDPRGWALLAAAGVSAIGVGIISGATGSNRGGVGAMTAPTTTYTAPPVPYGMRSFTVIQNIGGSVTSERALGAHAYRAVRDYSRGY